MFPDCENCWYNALDEEAEEYFCSLYLDEDEFYAIKNEYNGQCRYFRPCGNEYDIVKKQN